VPPCARGPARQGVRVAYLKALPRPRRLSPRTLAAKLRRRRANPSRPPLRSAPSPPFCRRGDPQEPCVEVRSTLVQLVHVPALQSTRSSMPDLHRRGRSLSAAVHRRRRPGVRLLSSRARARRSCVFPARLGCPEPLTAQRRRSSSSAAAFTPSPADRRRSPACVPARPSDLDPTGRI
jgi:hypothetical protein